MAGFNPKQAMKQTTAAENRRELECKVDGYSVTVTVGISDFQKV